VFTSARVFRFQPRITRYVHLNVLSIHRSQDADPRFVAVRSGEIAFAQSTTPVPFEFGTIPGIIGIVAVGGINYFRNKKAGKDK